MAPIMRALACSQAQEYTHFSLKYFEASIIIAMDGMDIDIALLVKLRKFIEECMVGFYIMECSATLTHNHFQMVVKGNFSSPLVLKKKIKVGLGWDKSPPTGHVVSCKKWRDESLHTFLGMVGYCLEDNKEEHFEFLLQQCFR